jgi:hypothetical protein
MADTNTYWTPAALPALAQSESSGNPTICNASGHCGLYQYSTPTWDAYAPAAGVDLSVYPTANTAPADVQSSVALVTPISNWTCPGCNSAAAGFAATPGYTTSSPGTLTDGLPGSEGFSPGTASSPGFIYNPDTGTYFNPDTGAVALPGTPGLTPPGGAGAGEGMPGDLGTGGTGGLANAGAQWWNTLVTIIGDYLVRFGLVLLALILIGVAAWALSKERSQTSPARG